MGLVYIHFSKAFEIFIEKLMKLGLDEQRGRWIENWLNRQVGRQECCEIQQEVQSPAPGEEKPCAPVYAGKQLCRRVPGVLKNTKQNMSQ